MSLKLMGALALLGAAAGLVQLLDRRIREGAKSERSQGARMASRRDLRLLRVSGSQSGRMILGRRGWRLLAAEQRASVIVFGPTLTQKTSGLVIPALLEWEGPVLATSVKSDLLFNTLARRRSMGETMIFDPLGVTGHETVRASPLTRCATWSGALKMARWLANSARTSSGGLQEAEFWYSAAEKLLAPILFAAACGGGSMRDVIGWLNDGAGAQAQVSDRLGGAEDEDAISAWKATWNRDERQRSSIYTTAETILAAFADPDVLEASCEPTYTPADLLDGSTKTLYLCAPMDEQDRLRALFAMMVCELVSVANASYAATSKPLDPPLLLILDEAANIAPVPNLDQIASTGAGQGIQLLSVFQDFAQMHTCYGERAKTIISNHRAKVICGGGGDPETLNYVRQVVGAGEFRQTSATTGEGRHSATQSSAYRDLLPANVIREVGPGEATLVYAHLPAMRLGLRPWFEDEQMTALVEGTDEQMAKSTRR